MATLYERMKRAWDSGTPNALDREAEGMARHGFAETEIYDALEQLLLTVRNMGVDEETEERIHGVMDRLTGWGHSANQIRTAQGSQQVQEHRNGSFVVSEFMFVKCVAVAVAEHGLHSLIGLVPGGEYAWKVAQSAHQKYRERKRDAALRDDIQQLAQANFEEAKRAAVEAAREVAAGAPIEDRVNLELYLTQIPAAVRASLKRPDDPTGKTVPPAFAFNSPDDVIKMLPQRLPRFRGGEPLPGAPGWVLVEQLGVGGFGEVWLTRFGEYEWSALHGAVKFCYGLDTRDLKHELALAVRAMQAGKHPGLVPVIAQHFDSNPPWVMYEYVAGGDLADRIREWSRLSPTERFGHVIPALRGLAEAVGRLHRLTEPVVHRDLKPSNVLFDPVTGQLRVTDFGIGGVAATAALRLETSGQSTRGGRLLSYLRGSHTPLYSSPQQRDGSDPDPRDDVHALGVIGYQMLTGHLGQGCGTDFEDDLREVGANDELIRVLKRCTAQKPDRRPRDAAELAAALASLELSVAENVEQKATPTTTVATGFAEWSVVCEWLDRKGWEAPADSTREMAGLRKEADRGNAAAQNWLGWLHQNGWGVAQDYAQAMAWYRKAAEQNDAAAQYNIGSLYHDGKGVAQNFAQAMTWYRKAAEQNHATAQFDIGWLHENGKGVPQDYAQAMAWYRKAAEQNFATAQNNIGALYANGQGVGKDRSKAIEWFRKAAAQGQVTAKEWLQSLGAA